MSSVKIVATPIGNLEDITLRAIKTLKEAKIIICEDTRVTKKLLNLTCEKYNCEKFIVYNDFANDNTRKGIIKLAKEHDLVLVSDAGSPLISDPGYKLIKDIIKENIKVECIPGVSSIIPGLTLSGLPTDNFYFYGFIKSEHKIKSELNNIKSTIIFFESANRLLESITLLQKVFGNVQSSISFELTKKFENTLRGTLSENIDKIHNMSTLKGEVVIVIDTREKSPINEIYFKVKINEIIKILLKSNSQKDVLRTIMNYSNYFVNKEEQVIKIKKNDIYSSILNESRSSNLLGISGENQAYEFLQKKGYKILERRKKTQYGEVDIIAEKNNNIIFVEVKISNIKNKAYFSISNMQKKRIVNSIQFLLSENNYYSNKNIRCDAIIIDQNKLDHIENIVDFENID